MTWDHIVVKIMKAKIIIKPVLTQPRMQEVVFDIAQNKGLVVREELHFGLLGYAKVYASVDHPHAGISKMGTGPGVGKHFTSEYPIEDIQAINHIVEDNLWDKEVEGELEVNPYAAVWGTSGDESLRFRLKYPKLTKRDSLSEVIKTQEQADDFIQKINELNFVMRLPIGLVKSPSGRWTGTYRNIVAEGETPEECETNLYKAIHEVFIYNENKTKDSVY